MLNEFRKFALKGNMLDMAVGIVIGAAFGTIVKSLVDDILMPPLGLITGGMDFSNQFLVLKEGVPTGPYGSLAAAQAAGATTMNWGLFLNALVSFLIVAFALFLVVRAFNRFQESLEREKEAAPPPPPSAEEQLLAEIRDLLKAKA